mmetsp:Transcript_16438/g.33676  ORF Transcript_16438/g.33676 Transcript_16438/m.33676 type:complete len:244 (-) Transcript_16438:525-1256(-)
MHQPRARRRPVRTRPGGPMGVPRLPPRGRGPRLSHHGRRAGRVEGPSGVVGERARGGEGRVAIEPPVRAVLRALQRRGPPLVPGGAGGPQGVEGGAVPRHEAAREGRRDPGAPEDRADGRPVRRRQPLRRPDRAVPPHARKRGEGAGAAVRVRGGRREAGAAPRPPRQDRHGGRRPLRRGAGPVPGFAPQGEGARGECGLGGAPQGGSNALPGQGRAARCRGPQGSRGVWGRGGQAAPGRIHG